MYTYLLQFCSGAVDGVVSAESKGVGVGGERRLGVASAESKGVGGGGGRGEEICVNALMVLFPFSFIFIIII
jgi:hypothetical protein